MSKIEYDYSKNQHLLDGPRVALPAALGAFQAQSLIDVGCGIGCWLNAAKEIGLTDLCGVDGSELSPQDLLFPADCFVRENLTQDWDLGRRFDVALCLEVGEHLEPQFARGLVRALTRHSDCIIFTGACPGQAGQHHVNCQWPDYWQRLFNAEGYACDDAVRWKIWNDHRIEPWYRQNMFVARRAPDQAGHEKRLPAVVHPDMLDLIQQSRIVEKQAMWKRNVMAGDQPLAWYLRTLVSATWGKLTRRMGASPNHR